MHFKSPFCLLSHDKESYMTCTKILVYNSLVHSVQKKSLNQVLSLYTSTRRQPFIMLGLGDLSLWQHYRITFGDEVVIVSLDLPHIVNSISSCLVIQLTFSCLLVVVKWFTLRSIRYVCAICHALEWAFNRLLRWYHMTNKSLISFWWRVHDVPKSIKKFCKKEANKRQCFFFNLQ